MYYILLIVLWILFYRRLRFIEPKSGKIIFSNETAMSIDCEEKRVGCITNKHCEKNCINKPILCVDEICVTKEFDYEEKCNPKHGIVAMLEGITELGAARWSCLSLYPTLFNNNDEKMPDICEGGHMEMDILKTRYNPRMCKCASDKTLIAKNINSSVDIVEPHCVKNPNNFIGFSIVKD